MQKQSGPYAAAAAAAPYPRMRRPQRGRVVAGVSAGLAEHLGVDVAIARLALALLALINGVGAVFYAASWVFIDAAAEDEAPRSKWDVPHGLYVAAAVLGIVGGLGGVSLVSGITVPTLVPLLVVAVGALLAWFALDRGLDSAVGAVSVGIGALFVLAGVVVTAWKWRGAEQFGPALLAVFLTMVGFGALVVPLIIKLWRSLAEQQSLKAVAEERAEIASRLHDSVLQTLALIQKRAEDPQEVMRLARAQERELRGWLFEPETVTAQTVFGAVEAACGEVEDLFGLRIAPVTVGQDAPLSDATKLAVQAAREAMVNAGKHAGVDTLDVYAEVLAGELTIFVRDRGRGFDPEHIPADRHGIRDSIRARMESAGGRSRISSTLGAGTEVEVAVAL